MYLCLNHQSWRGPPKLGCCFRTFPWDPWIEQATSARGQQLVNTRAVKRVSTAFCQEQSCPNHTDGYLPSEAVYVTTVNVDKCWWSILRCSHKWCNVLVSAPGSCAGDIGLKSTHASVFFRVALPLSRSSSQRIFVLHSRKSWAVSPQRRSCAAFSYTHRKCCGSSEPSCQPSLCAVSGSDIVQVWWSCRPVTHFCPQIRTIMLVKCHTTRSV